MNQLFPPISPARSLPFRLAMAFAAVALVGGGGYLAWQNYTQTTQRSGEIRQLQTAVQQETSRATALQSELHQRELTLGSMKSELEQRTPEVAELRDQLLQREAELDDAHQQLTLHDSSLQRLAQQSETFVALFKNPASKVVLLSGSDMAKSAGAFLLVDPASKKAWLYAFNLPALPNGKVYQLWAIDDKPVSAGIFGLDSGQKARMLLKNMAEFPRMKKFAVTVQIVFLDYLTLIGTDEDDWRGTAKISADLQAIAGRYQIPIVALSQINRSGIGKPRAEHLSQSDAVGQDADLVVTQQQITKRVTKHFIAKFRHGVGGDSGTPSSRQAQANFTKCLWKKRARLWTKIKKWIEPECRIVTSRPSSNTSRSLTNPPWRFCACVVAHRHIEWALVRQQ